MLKRIEIRWLIVYKVRENVQSKLDNFSIFNLERMAIAASNRDKSLNIGMNLLSFSHVMNQVMFKTLYYII